MNTLIFDIISIVSTFAPYFFYAWVYKYPRSFSRFFTQKTLIKASTWNKIIGCFCHAPACFKAGINGPGLCIAIPFIFVGQYLSELVYNLLGDNGVYYGIELKTARPVRIQGFPFTIRDPQYKGSILTVLGWFFAFNTTKELILLAIPWMISYYSIVIVENTQGGVDNVESKKE